MLLDQAHDTHTTVLGLANVTSDGSVEKLAENINQFFCSVAAAVPRLPATRSTRAYLKGIPSLLATPVKVEAW